MYVVNIYHFRPCYINGDLDSESQLQDVKHFKTLKETKAFIERSVKGKYGEYIAKDKLGGIYFTQKKWVEENTGEERQEHYTYQAKKI